MIAAILAGGQGSRLSEETRVKSKAMVKIGDRPILWHLLKYYEHYGFGEFVIALGHHAESIRDYFEQLGHRLPPSSDGPCRTVYPGAEPAWTVKLVDTGIDTMSGGRIKQLAPYLDQAPFMLTWCDGLANVDLDKLRTFHRSHGGLATLTAIHPPARFGRIILEHDRITAFEEKTTDPSEWINGAFFALDPGVFAYITGDETQFEREPLTALARSGELMAYRHDRITAFEEKTTDPSEWINGAFFALDPGVFAYIAGDETQFEYEPLSALAHAGELMAYRHDSFWQCMDTLKEAQDLNAMWQSGQAPWKVWA